MFVLQKAVRTAAADQVLLHLVDGMRPRVCRREREAAVEALLRTQLQSVIRGIAHVVAKLDGSKIRVRDDRRGESVGVEVPLVQVTQNRKMRSLRAHVF